jgi:hypothetical protein
MTYIILLKEHPLQCWLRSRLLGVWLTRGEFPTFLSAPATGEILLTPGILAAPPVQHCAWLCCGVGWRSLIAADGNRDHWRHWRGLRPRASDSDCECYASWWRPRPSAPTPGLSSNRDHGPQFLPRPQRGIEGAINLPGAGADRLCFFGSILSPFFRRITQPGYLTTNLDCYGCTEQRSDCSQSSRS